MKISAGQVQLAAESRSAVRQTKTERLQVWTDAAPRASGQDALALSPRAAAPVSASTATDPVDDALTLDPKLQLLKALIEALTGEKIRTISARDLQPHTTPMQIPTVTTAANPAPAPARQGWGVDYYAQTTTTETQQLTLAAQGTVTTTDGRDIAFTLHLDVARQYLSEETLHILASDAAIDPLVINLQGFTAALADTRFSFDLDRDGTAESPHTLPAGSGFLTLDRNGNGAIDDGGELFGPATGNGFTELTRYDVDGNGWLDEQDPAFAQLGVWAPGTASQSLASLRIGAISVQSIAAPFTHKDAANALTGATRTAGIFLYDDGTPGTVQQIDLVG